MNKEQPESLRRYKIGYVSDEWGMQSTLPSGIQDPQGPWVRYEDVMALHQDYKAARLEIDSLKAQRAQSAPNDDQVMAITTAYEQGVGKGHDAYSTGKEIDNPYSSGWNCGHAWSLGYAEGKEQANREAHDDQKVPATQAAPDGWKLVPVEPTHWMLREFTNNIDTPQATNSWSNGYRAMLAAAPTPPVEAQQQAQEPNWSGSETLPTELWKNPMYSLADRLVVADGAVAYQRKVEKNLRAQFSQLSLQQASTPYGVVTTHSVTGQQFFYRWPEPPYLDNAKECVTVYTLQPMQQPQSPTPIAYLTYDADGSPAMLFFDKDEALAYCEVDEFPTPLYLNQQAAEIGAA